MKTDTVLTMNEYFDACCGVPKHADPPADNAGHIPITSEGDIGPGARSTVAGATAGAIRLVLKSGSRDSAPRPTSFFYKANEVNKHGIRNCIQRGRDDGALCADHQAMLERT